MPAISAFIEGIGGPELLMVMFIVLLLFGANKLPELARGLGKAMNEIKKATNGVEEEIRNAMDEKPEPSDEAKRFAPKPVVVPAANTQPNSAPATPATAQATLPPAPSTNDPMSGDTPASR